MALGATFDEILAKENFETETKNKDIREVLENLRQEVDRKDSLLAFQTHQFGPVAVSSVLRLLERLLE